MSVCGGSDNEDVEVKQEPMDSEHMECEELALGLEPNSAHGDSQDVLADVQLPRKVLRGGPIFKRLAWEPVMPSVRTEPIKRARGVDAWEQTCTATCYETGQLIGKVGTPEDPQFTYEEAMHHRCGRTNLELHAGRSISTEENAKLSQATALTLKRLHHSVKESRLPLLPLGVIPKGWDAWGRPWALMDCPADKVPGIASVHNHHRVTVAVLVCFPPEPFFYPDVEHMERALQYRTKAGKKKVGPSCLELTEGGQIKDPRRTYERLTPPGYSHSVPVQELLREPRWQAYREGQWGHRPNPPVPEGDVRPQPGQDVSAVVAPTAAVDGTQVDEQADPSSSDSAGSPGLDSAQQVTLPPESDGAAVEDMEILVPASPPLISAPRSPQANGVLKKAVTSSAIITRQAAANTQSVATTHQPSQSRTRHSQRQQEDGASQVTESESGCSTSWPISSHRSESRSHSHSQPSGGSTFPPETAAIRWTRPGAEPRWAPVDPRSMAEIETAVQQSMRGAAETSLEYTLQLLDRVRSEVETQFRQGTLQLQTAHQTPDAYGRPDSAQRLMGQIQHLWDRNITSRKQIDILGKEKITARQQSEALAKAQTKLIAENNRLGARVETLERENDELRRQLEEAQASSQHAIPTPASESDCIREWKATTERLECDNRRLREERNRLQDHNRQLQGESQKLRDAKILADATVTGLLQRVQQEESQSTTLNTDYTTTLEES